MADDDLKSARADDAKRYWTDGGYASGGVVRQVDYSKERGGVDPLFQGIKIVDTDTHFTEPPDLFTSRAPASYKDKVPYQKRINGIDHWMLGDRDMGMIGGNVISKDHNKLLGQMAYPKLEDAHPGIWQVKPRLEAMDDMGVHAQICFQNGGVTQAGTLMALPDQEQALTIIRIFNDGAMDRQKESGQRLFSLAQLPIWNQKEMEKEARRCIDGGLRGFVLPDIPERYAGVGAFNEPYWASFFEMCEASGTPINFHLASAMDPGPMMWRGFDFGQRLAIGAMMMFMGNAATMANFICSGILDKYPKLKIGMIESGAGWVPFVVEALEHQFDEMMPNRSAKLRPTEYFHQNFWITFWFEKLAPQKLIEDIGDRLMFETDFPHPTSLYPGVQRHLVEALGKHPYAVRKAVLQDNPTALYRLPF